MAQEDPKKKPKKKPTVVKSAKDLPPGGVWETNAEGKRQYVKRSKYKKPDSTTHVDTNKNKSISKAGAWKPKDPTNNPPKGGDTEEIYVIEDTVDTELPPPPPPPNKEDKWKAAFQGLGYEGERFLEPQLTQNLPPTYIDGKRAKVFGYILPAKRDSNNKAWSSNEGVSNGGTQVFGYEHPTTGEVVLFDPSTLSGGKERSINGKTEYVYTNEDIIPYSYDKNVKKNFEQGAVHQVGDESYLNSLGIKVDRSLDQMGTLNARQGGYNKPVLASTVDNGDAPFQGSIQSDAAKIDLDTQKQNIIKSNLPNKDEALKTNAAEAAKLEAEKEQFRKDVERKRMEKTTSSFKKGGIVGKYAPGGVVKNPAIKYNDQKIYQQNANKILANQIQGIDPNATLPTEDATKTGLAAKYGNLTPNEKAGLGSMISMGADAGAGMIDAADRKDGRSSYIGQIDSGAVKGAGKGAALTSSFGPEAMLVGAVAGAVIGGTMGGVRAGKEKKAHREFTANEFSEAAANSQFDPANPNKVTRASDYDERDYKTIKGSLDGGLKMNGLGKKFGVTKFAATGGLIEKYNKGGQIVGSGTGTSDSISADIKGKSFVVPAENSGIAKLIRRDVLSDNPNKKAELKQGGVPVKVSNGEHLFTPEEVKELTAKGIDLDKLAPEAQTKLRGEYKFAKGGGVGDEPKVTTKRRYSSGNPSIDAEIDNLYKTGKWDEESVSAIEQKAKALGIDTGEQFLNPSKREGVFSDIYNKKLSYSDAVNRTLQTNKQQKDYEAKRNLVSPNLSNSANEADKKIYYGLKDKYVKTGADGGLSKFVSQKNQELKAKTAKEQAFARDIETGKKYVSLYKADKDLEEQLNYATANTDKYTSQQLKELTNKKRDAAIALNKLKVPGQYANNETKARESAYEAVAKKTYKPSFVAPNTQVSKPAQKEAATATTQTWEWD